MPHRFPRPRTREQALTLWAFVGSVLTVVAGLLGVGYLIGGNGAARSPSYYLIKDLVPGAMRTHGFLLCVLAIGLAYVVFTSFDRHSVWILRVFAGYCFLVAICFFGSWSLTGEITWGGPVLWSGLGALAEGMVMLPPDSLREDPAHALGDLDSALGGSSPG